MTFRIESIPVLAGLSLMATLAWGDAGHAQTALSDLPQSAQARLPDLDAMAARLAEAPGLPVRLIVEFAAPVLPDGVQAGTAQADALQIAGVAATQDRILGRVLGTGPDGVQADPDLSLRRLTYSPMLALNADAALIAALAADPEVVRIVIDQADAPGLTASLPLIGMPAASAAGATGQGQTVAVLDSGARLSHEFLTFRVDSGACFNTNDPATGTSSRCPGGATTSTARASAEDCTEVTTQGCGHGTHVAGIVAGLNGNVQAGEPLNGVASDARILAINVMSLRAGAQCGPLPDGVTACLRGLTSDQIAALEHVYSLRSSVSFAAVNMSLGGGQFAEACTTDPRRGIMQQLTNAGIPVVIAAGNNGFTAAVTSPACIPEAIVVGSTTLADGRSSFSNWGALVDIAAPGSGILSSYINGTSNTFYDTQSGTSMAAPHVAGALAALRSAQPNVSVADMMLALRRTGTPVTAAGVTVPRINVDQALTLLTADRRVTTTTLTGPDSVAVGRPVTLVAAVSASVGVPWGEVAFFRNGVEFARAPLDEAGLATLTTYALTMTGYSIEAHYVGAPGYHGSVSNSVYVQVGGAQPPLNDAFADRIPMPAPGVYAGSSNGATREAGEPWHFGGPSTNHALEHSIWWSITPTADGTATFDTCGSTNYTVVAVYTGSSVDNLSLVGNGELVSCRAEPVVTIPVTAGQRYAVVVGANGGGYGDVRLTASFPHTPGATSTTLTGDDFGYDDLASSFVANVAPAGARGAVSLRLNGVEVARALVGDGTIDPEGEARLFARLPAGTHQLTAHFLGAPGFLPSISDPWGVVIQSTRRPTLTTVSGPATGAAGATFAFDAQVTDVQTGAPVAGVVVFRANGVDFASASTDGAGVAGVSAGMPLGSHQITAHFLGSTTHEPSNSSAYTFVVEASAATTTTLDGPTTGQTGQTLTYTATVSAAAGTPGGTVSFRRGGVEFATGTLNGQGVATGGGSFPEGTHPITAHYLGAAGFQPSASAARSVTVTPGTGLLEFVGGGTVFEFTAACAAGGWPNTPHPARLRYGPGEVNGMPSQVGILFPSGSEHLQTWHALAQSTLNYDALGRQMWTLFVLQQPFPRTTPVQRRITQPANGTDIATATEVMLRLRVSGFGGIPGCGATVAGVLRRAG